MLKYTEMSQCMPVSTQNMFITEGRRGRNIDKHKKLYNNHVLTCSAIGFAPIHAENERFYGSDFAPFVLLQKMKLLNANELSLDDLQI